MPKQNKKTKSKSSPPVTDNCKFTWLPKKTFELTITIPQENVVKAYAEVLEEASKDMTIKGFRKGKAPKNLVEAQVGKEKLYEKVVQKLLTIKYLEAVRQHNLRPIIPPKVSVVSMKEGEDWVVKAVSCEMPEIKLGNWEQAVKGEKAAAKIWTPDSAKKTAEGPSQKQETEQQKLTKIFNALIKEAQIDLSDMVIDEEAARMLSSLLDQVNKLGITIDQYLLSRSQTSEQLREEYKQSAERTIKLEFILAKIAEEKKIGTTDKDIEQALAGISDEKEKKKLESPEQKHYLSSVLRKRKTIDYLLSL